MALMIARSCCIVVSTESEVLFRLVRASNCELVNIDFLFLVLGFCSLVDESIIRIVFVLMKMILIYPGMLMQTTFEFV